MPFLTRQKRETKLCIFCREGRCKDCKEIAELLAVEYNVLLARGRNGCTHFAERFTYGIGGCLFYLFKGFTNGKIEGVLERTENEFQNVEKLLFAGILDEI